MICLKKGNVKIKFSYEDKGPNIEVNMHINLSRFVTQLDTAQYALDSQVMLDMIPYMPKQTGTFIDVTQGKSASMAGTGTVVAAAPPMGRFLYEGEIMVDEKTGSPWARKASKKIKASEYSAWEGKSTKLVYNKSENHDAQSHWFEAAKKKHAEDWIEMVKEEGGGG